MDFVSGLRYVGARMREPSTYAGLAVLLGAFHVTNPDVIAPALAAFGVFAGATIAVVFPDPKA